MWGQSYAVKKATKFIKKNHLEETKDMTRVVKKNPSKDDASLQSSGTSVTQKLSFGMSNSKKDKKKAKITNANDLNLEEQRRKAKVALKHIQETVSLQEDREDDIQLKIKESMTTAKEKLTGGNKRAAIRYMKKVKMYQFELNKVGAAIETLEIQTMSIESSLNHMDVLVAMHEGKNAMQRIEAGTNAEDVEIVLDEIRDTIDYSREIDDILSHPVDDLVIDDDELLKELAEYGSTDTDTSLLESLPEVPQTPIEKNDDQEKESKPFFWNAA